MLELPTSTIVAYILAGGRSTRMGRDKAMLPLAGKTLLRRAVETLGTVATEVVLLGDRHDLQGADRAIPDLHPGCGPVGGMETALRDLSTHPTQNAAWACFLPVDMPFVPAGLYAALMRHWLDQASSGVRIAFANVDGVPQPLISLLHVSALPRFTAAVAEGRLRVSATLQTVAQELALGAGHAPPAGPVQLSTGVFTHPPAPQSEADFDLPWRPSPQQLAARPLWFSNLNTPEEFAAGERFLASGDLA